MPAQILHILHAEEALLAAADALGGERRVRGWSDEFGAWFRLGAQGPDLFYHSQRSRPVALEYGTLLHRRGFGTFTAALLRRTLTARATSAQPTLAAAYALGFAAHAFLDRGLHPYIVSKSGWVAPSRPETARYARCHAFFERIIDSLMLERQRSQATADWDQDRNLTAACADPDKETTAALLAALRETFPERAGSDAKLAKRLANAFRDAAKYYRIANPARTSLNGRFPDGFEYLAGSIDRSAVALVYPEGFPRQLDYLNLARAPWRHPGRSTGEVGAYICDSLPDLYVLATVQAADFYRRLLVHFAATGRVADAVADWLGDGGLSIVDALGAPCVPFGAAPLPLEAVLEDQYRRRLAWLNHSAPLSRQPP